MRKVMLSVIIVLLALPVLAQQDAIPVDPKSAVAEFLALTPDQVSQWDALIATREQTVPPLREQLKGIEDQIKALLAQPNPDPAAVGALVIQAAAVKEQLDSARGAYVSGFEAMLTSDQTARLNFIRRAAKARPLIPAFRLAGLLPPPQRVE
ncbi:MAG TPA: periplasmic heavy metal sensor [Thermoanaerobaculaceae bacterium]|nr:periplasmic heavy metal sensor [Thermoanaerobaculaceae bacterium]